MLATGSAGPAPGGVATRIALNQAVWAVADAHLANIAVYYASASAARSAHVSLVHLTGTWRQERKSVFAEHVVKEGHRFESIQETMEIIIFSTTDSSVEASTSLEILHYDSLSLSTAHHTLIPVCSNPRSSHPSILTVLLITSGLHSNFWPTSFFFKNIITFLVIHHRPI